jgi:microcystin-dependent protein
MNPFIGTILMVGFNFAPVGWALCEGQLLQISQYTPLFSLLGTTYGGDGIHTFALPDLRGRMPIGMGQGTGLPMYNLGQSGAIGGPAAVAPQVASDHFLAVNFIIALYGVFPSRA